MLFHYSWPPVFSPAIWLKGKIKVGVKTQGMGIKDQRDWVFEVREVKSENKKLSLFFEKCKVKKNTFTLFREVQSEKKVLSLFFKKCKVKSKCFHSFSRSEK